MKRLRRQEAGEAACAQPWVISQLTPAHREARRHLGHYPTDTSLPRALWILVTLCPLLQQLLCLWFYLVPRQCGLWYLSFPSTVQGLPEVRVLPGKTQQLRSCACSCSAAPTPQGRHPGHEYIQDIWINENTSSLEPNVNQALLKSTDIKYLLVLKELIQTCSLLDPKQLLSRS